jgi:hypothetical protein
MAHEVTKIRAGHVDIEDFKRVILSDFRVFMWAGVFSGDKSNPTVIPHGMGGKPRHADIALTGEPPGDLGDVWYTADEISIYVYNNGSGTAPFTLRAYK